MAATIKADDVPRLMLGLRKEHPRLLFTIEDQKRIQTLARTDPFLHDLINYVQRCAEAQLLQPPIENKFKGSDLLSVSRQCLRLVLDCSLTYRLTGDRRFADRAKRELLAATAFPTWHPAHYLDTAEMTTAVAIGYDWLYDYLTPEERATIRGGIIAHGLFHSYKFYPNKEWAGSGGNWNQVCNGGMTLGALAVAEDQWGQSDFILRSAITSIGHSLPGYAPDGVWAEGPVYWNYATSYTALFVSALQTALGTDGGFPGYPGLDRTGTFEVQMTGPTGLHFNFGDADDTSRSHSELFWLSRVFNQPQLAFCERQRLAGEFSQPIAGNEDRLLAMNVVWYDGRGTAVDLQRLPLCQAFYGKAEVAVMRSAWNDPQAIYVGLKAGQNGGGHGHLDLGSFVLDADGQRWATDLGPDDYGLHGYFDGKGQGAARWKIYRVGSNGHNTLTIDGTNQNVDSWAPLSCFKSDPNYARAIVDLSQAYPQKAGSVRRGVALLDSSRVLVQDELKGLGGNSEVRWGMITPADVRLDHGTALLTQKDATLKAEILSPPGANFEVVSTQPGNAAENPNAGTRMLIVRITNPPTTGTLKIAVLLTPQGNHWQPHPPLELKDLDAW